MSEATPRPWHLHPSGRANALELFTVFCGHGETQFNQVCQAEKGDAELIVRAVNAHDELIDLITMAADVIDDELENQPARHSLGELHARLCAVIANKPEPA